MCIEIKNREIAKQILIDVYKINYNYCKLSNDKKYLKLKLRHSFDCDRILKVVFPNVYSNYSIPILLHDIGRFFEYKKINNFKHEEYGYNYLRNNFIASPLVLLPIKYHESDVNWKDKIIKENEYIDAPKIVKKDVINCTEILRDIDVISNMKSLAKTTGIKKIKKVNINLISKLEKERLASKDDIKNEYDEIVYILCGLSIISKKNSFDYLKKKKIVKNLIHKLRKINKKNDNHFTIETERIEKFIYDRYKL